MSDAASLRGAGRWDEALALLEDPLSRADALNEQALFTGSAEARDRAGRELDRAEAMLFVERGRVLHARFLAGREEDPRELELFERALELARRTDDRMLLGRAYFWVGLFHQVVRDDHEYALPFLEEAYALAGETGDAMGASYAVRHLGFAYDAAGNADEAWGAFQESVRLREEDGFLPGVAAGLLTLGEVAAERRRPDEARAYLERAGELARQVGAAPFLARIEAALEAL